MKAYIIYIATLLAALVLPATAQTGSTDTKAAPGFPSMPYRLTVNTIGDNQGEVTFKDKNSNGGVVTIDNIPHAYGNQDASNTTTVTPKITPNKGYTLDDGYPKAYKTGDDKTVVTIAADGTFAMPTHPVTIDVKYIKVDDLDLSLATLTGKNVTLTYDGSKKAWTYKVGDDGTPTSFTGTLKGKGTCNLKITSSNGGSPNLYLANGMELTGNIEVATQNDIKLGLDAMEAGTVATVRGNITFNQYTSLKCYISLRLNIYGTVTGSNGTANFMQWTWTDAPKSGKTITIYTPLEETLTTFTADGTHTTFATSFPYGNNIAQMKMKVKVGDAIQRDKDKKIIFPTDDVYGYLCPFTDMQDSELKPVEDVDGIGITITSDNTYKPGTDGSGTPASFSGTITGDVSTIKVDAAVTENPIIILNDVKTDNTVEVADQAKVTLALKGTANEISTMTVAAGGTLTLTTVAGGASFANNTPPTIANNGNFTSETRLIKKVEGAAPLEVTVDPVGKQIAKDEEYTLKVEANIPAPAAPTAMTRSTGPVLSYNWESYTPKNGWEFIKGANGSTYTTTKVGTYRCGVFSTNGNAETILITQVAEVTLKSDPDPVPDPDPTPPPYVPTTYYNITLPSVEGFTSDPAAGTYVVEEGFNFSFSLTKKEGYTGNNPVVTTSRGETIAPRESDGKYVIRNIDQDITVSYTSLPTANNTPEADAIRVWSTTGALHISTPLPAPLDIYTLSGQCLKRLKLSAGDSRIMLPAGLYLIRMADRQRKIIVR